MLAPLLNLFGPVHRGWAITAGLLGAAAYLLAQAADLALFRNGANDLKLLGMAVTRRSPFWQFLGTAAHFSFGTLLALLYALTLGRWLPFRPWVSGLVFAQVENAVLSALLLPLLDRVHPAIRRGDLPRYLTPIPVIQQVFRHLAYGVVLGLVYGDVGRKLHR
ncbi:MAG: hypothetical protein RMM58_03555 [Chloroflexota bacterium]|nr:hypothetical protein [Dehalococcoidia bacterium]MDW8252936.1 hypothetical protein [Chloroflexota bacterium]